MGIYRCNGCGYLAEMTNGANGAKVPCPQCGRPNQVYDSVLFVRKLLDMYFAMRSAYQGLQAQLDGQDAANGAGDSSEAVRSAAGSGVAPAARASAAPVQAAAPATTPPAAAPAAQQLAGIDLHNTQVLSTEAQHRPIADWFATKRIAVQINPQAIDTSGFFDEVAIELGRNFEQFKPLLEQIRYAQTRSWTQINVALDRLSQREGQALTAFCRQLYEYSFLGRFVHLKNERVLRLGLQPSARVRDFFAGEWLEWFALMEVLGLAQERGVAFSCARNLGVTFPNEDLHELDIFWLVAVKGPVCIECKSGEFRPLLAKYGTLARRLGLTKAQFVLCVAGLPDDQAAGLTSMYDITLVSERGLRPHLERLL